MRQNRAALGPALALVLIAGCATSAGPTAPAATPSPSSIGESMPGPAWVWLTTSPAAPAVAVSVSLASASDPAIRYAHTFPAGKAVEGSFFTSEGRYTLSALSGACVLSLSLSAGDEAQVVLTLAADGCSVAVAWQGRTSDLARPSHDPGASLGAGSGS